MKNAFFDSIIPLPQYTELPSIELYLDQVLRVVNDAVRPYVFSEKDAPLTGTMVNNYVKHEVLPAPQKKLYRREHLAKLIVITIMKSVYSIPEIKQFFIAASQHELPMLYNLFCSEISLVSESLQSGRSVEIPDAPIESFLRIMVSSALSKLYIQHRLSEVQPAEKKS